MGVRNYSRAVVVAYTTENSDSASVAASRDVWTDKTCRVAV